MISIDSLRADRCGHLGGKELTPTLDKMADDGVAFTEAVAPGPKTPESMPAVFTGQQWCSPSKQFNLESWVDSIRPHMQAHDTLAQKLSRKGYETIGFSPNGFTTEYFGFDHGFDHFEDFIDDEFRPGFDIPNFLRGLIKFVRKEGNWKTWERYYDQVFESVQSATEPYFLWVFLLDVHSPYLVPREYRRENSFLEMLSANWRRDSASESEEVHSNLLSAYDDTVPYIDDFLSRLQQDIADTNPVYVVHSDHGEAFGERGYYGHDRLLYQENVHVPFVLGNTRFESTLDRPVSLMAIPDLLEAIADEQLKSFVEELGADIWRHPAVAHSEEGERTALRLGSYKYISKRNGSPELYNLDRDPDERENIATDASNLQSTLDSYVSRFAAARTEEQCIRQTVKGLTESSQL